jgi:hypothetical protein
VYIRLDRLLWPSIMKLSARRAVETELKFMIGVKGATKGAREGRERVAEGRERGAEGRKGDMEDATGGANRGLAVWSI